MKAYLLAAGFGTRLRPLTETVPKCLVPIQGSPLLEWWLKLLKQHGITEVLINTHYLRESVETFIKNYNDQKTGLTITAVYEPHLVGSGGTVKANQNFIGEEEDFLICYADNLTNANLTELIGDHRKKGSLLTVALFHTDRPEQCGIPTVDDTGRITEFIEKPENPKSNLANAGIYVANRKIFAAFPDQEFIDFGKDILPRLAGQMYGWQIRDYLIDIGTPDNYRKANEEWKYDRNQDAV